jgi:hypothetical protein
MTDDEIKNLEKREIDLLIEKGVNFEVDQVSYRKLKGFWGFFKSRAKVNEKVKYTIYEPTLSTLDRLAAEQLELNINENVLSSDDALGEAKRMSSQQTKRMSRILAIAVLGQEYVKPIHIGPYFKYVYDEKKLNRLTEIFFTNIKPSKLLQLTVLINSISNLSDFINSIRLMSAVRTTMPDLIEANKKV